MNWDALTAYWPAVLIAGALLAGAGAVYSGIKKRPSAEELERRRRALIQQTGKMGDGTIVDFQPGLISYSYMVRGIEYQATQELAGLEDYLPPEPADTIGAVSVKYDSRNPANSIVVSEQWSGLRRAKTTL